MRWLGVSGESTRCRRERETAICWKGGEVCGETTTRSSQKYFCCWAASAPPSEAAGARAGTDSTHRRHGEKGVKRSMTSTFSIEMTSSLPSPRSVTSPSIPRNSRSTIGSSLCCLNGSQIEE